MDAANASSLTPDADLRVHICDWLPVHVASIQPSKSPQIPVVKANQFRRLAPDLDVWDAWPLQLSDGRVARFDGAVVWMALSAPVMGDPALRHQRARIRLILEKDGAWHDCGPAMPDGFSPGACEWSGSAVFHPETARVDLHFTATSRRGEAFKPEQRLFTATARLAGEGRQVRLADWTAPVEMIPALAPWRAPAVGEDKVAGFINALRDPAVFRDPKDGRDYMVYAASLAEGGALYNGAVGVAAAAPGGGWRDLGPLIRARGVNHELERPHIVHAQGCYYLFWCTQQKMFSPSGPSGPTGLYAMVATSVLGPYAPVNGSGLVAGNPASEPNQTYAWWVTGEGDVYGFVDLWGTAGQSEAYVSAHPRDFFGGAIAPPFRLELQGAQVRLTDASI